jgi:hypothetical protein
MPIPARYFKKERPICVRSINGLSSVPKHFRTWKIPRELASGVRREKKRRLSPGNGEMEDYSVWTLRELLENAGLDVDGTRVMLVSCYLQYYHSRDDEEASTKTFLDITLSIS